MKHKHVAVLSKVIYVVCFLISIIALPFALIAGLGALIALPFGYFAFTERETITPLFIKNKKFPKGAYKARAYRVLYCAIGMTIIQLLVWWSNAIGPDDGYGPTLQFLKSLLWIGFIALVMLSPQLLYRKK